MCLSNKLDRLHIQSVTNDIPDDNKGKRVDVTDRTMSAVAGNWTHACDRLIELIEANELAQMNTADLQTYSKLIVELDSAIHDYRRAIAK